MQFTLKILVSLLSCVETDEVEWEKIYREKLGEFDYFPGEAQEKTNNYEIGSTKYQVIDFNKNIEKYFQESKLSSTLNKPNI